MSIDEGIKYIFEKIGLLNKDYFTRQIDFEEYSRRKNEIYKEFKGIIKKDKDGDNN